MPPSLSDARLSPVNAIPVGGQFYQHGKLWQVTRQGSHTEATSVGGRDEIRRYYDPLTAEKAGEFSWSASVQVVDAAYVAVDPATLLGRDGAVKLTEIAWLLAGGLGYDGLIKWLAMWPDIDTALREARRASEPMVAT